MVSAKVREKLETLDIYPFSVFFTYSVRDGLLGLTFFFEQDLQETLEFLLYKSQCDKSGYVVLPETCTLLLHGLALIQLWTKL